MKKVLFIGMTPIVGGIDTFILNIFLNLNNKYQFEFINTFDKPLAYSNVIIKNGGIIRHINVKQNIFKYFTRYHYAKKFFEKHHDYDLVDVNASTINKIFWIKAAKKYGIKHCILHSHISSSDESPLHKWVCKYLVRYNRKYLYSHNILKWAASTKCGQWMFGNKADFRVINNGIDTNMFIHNKHERYLIRKKLGLSNNDKVVITTSRLEYEKNYPKIIRVFLHLHKINQLSRLVIIGDGSKESFIKELVHSYHLDNDVYFLGRKNREDIPKYLNIADLMLMPSYHEGMPYSLLEAQAAGVPALVSTGISNRANVTGCVKYLSLNISDYRWAQCANEILDNGYDINNKIKMNKYIKNSPFSLQYFINNIYNLYKFIMN